MIKRILFCLLFISLFAAGSVAQSKRKRPIQQKSIDIHKINFKAVKYQVDEEELSQKDLEVLSVKFGDLTGDGTDEAVVYISWSFARYGGNGYGYWVDIFTVENNKLKFLTRLDGGGKSGEFQIKLLDIEDSQLIVRQCELGDNFDEFLATVKYEWNGERLVEVSRSSVKVQSGCWG